MTEWQMEEGDKKALRAAMNRAAMGSDDAGDIRALVEKFGKRHLAEIMAAERGTKVSSQMRNIDRRLDGTRGRGKALDAAIEQATRKEAAQRIRDAGSVDFEMVAEFGTSRTAWSGKAKSTLTGQALADFADAIEAGDSNRAAQIGAGQYFHGGSDVVLSVDEIEQFKWS